MKKIEIFLLTIILLAGFIVRLYRFNNPIADWHSWRQADTSAVSRNFIKFGFDVLHPRFDDLSNVPSHFADNPNGYRFAEFPIYNLAQAGLFKFFDNLTIEEWGRLVSIFSSLISSVFIYLIVKKYFNKTAGILSSFFYVFLPYSIYYSRAILPDSSMVTAILAGIYFFDQWLDSKSKIKSESFFILSIIFTASAFLLKPYALFFTLPMVYLVWKKFGFDFLKNWRIWFFVIISLAPLVFWRIWMIQYPEGIPANAWLFNEGNIRFKGAFFNWIFAERIGKLILGYWGVGIFMIGIIRKKNNIFFLSFLLSSILYLFVLARGNVQHDYYQILIVPTISIFLGIGGEFLLNVPKELFSKKVSVPLFVIFSIFMFSFSWFIVRDYFNINNRSIVTAGAEIDKLIPQNAKIIANLEGDTSFLYQTKRQGWASFEKPIPEMIDLGADYLALVNPKEEDYNLGEKYKIVSAKKEYILFNLKEKP